MYKSYAVLLTYDNGRLELLGFSGGISAKIENLPKP